MRLSTTSSLLAFIASATAMEIALYKNPQACNGVGIVCTNIGTGDCCGNGDAFGSGVLQGKGAGDQYVQLYSRKDRNNCGSPTLDRGKGPICILSLHEGSISGARPFGSLSRLRREEDENCNKVEGSPMYVNGGKMYILSKDKQALAKEAMPTEDKDLLEYFKKNAEEVRDHETVAAMGQN